MPTLCRIDSLSMHYGERRVLTDVSFAVERGELFVVVGPNGSGKSTLLRLLAGLAVPTGGRFSLGDGPEPAHTARERARRLAYVPQHYPESLPFTVEGTVLLGRAPWQNYLGAISEEDKALCRDAMKCVQVGHLAGSLVSRLSGGERQRVMLGQALCQNTEILLLDEPTSALDYGHQMLIMGMLRRACQERGLTIIMVLHDVNLAAMFADRVLMLQGGQAVACGPAEALFTGERLAALYGCPFVVDVHPVTGRPRVAPYALTARAENPSSVLPENQALSPLENQKLSPLEDQRLVPQEKQASPPPENRP